MRDYARNLLRYFGRAPGYLFALLITVWSAGAVIYAADAQKYDDSAFIKYGCYQCHGYLGQGGLLSGPRIAPSTLPYEAFSEIVRRPYGVMPAYAPDVLEQTELKKIYHYLQSIRQDLE